MLQWCVLLQCLVSASLILTGFQPDAEEGLNVSFSDNEVQVETIRATLKQDILKIEGADINQNLLCFREGQLIFPNNPQQLSGEFKGRDGDVLVWVRLDRQAADFGDLMLPEEGPPMRLNQVDFRKVYRFQISQDPSTLKSKVTNFLAIKRPVIRKATDLLAIIGLVIVVGFLIELVIWWSTLPPPQPTPMCSMPNMRQYYHLYAGRAAGWPHYFEFNFEVPRDCSDRVFNLTRYADRVNECLAHFFPDINVTDWELPGGWRVKPWFLNATLTPPDNCSLPEANDI